MLPSPRMLHLLVILLQSVCYSAPTKPFPSVSTHIVKVHEISDEMVLPARIVPKTNATLTSETEGVVREIYAPLGTQVKKGQRILNVTNTDPVYHYGPAYVQAPIEGVVSQVEVSVGTRVQKGQKLATVTNPKDVKLVTEVASHELSVIKPGLKAAFFEPTSQKPIAAQLVGISPAIDPLTGTASAEFKFEGTNSLLPGLLGKLVVKTGSHTGFEIPEQAITYRGQDPHVRLVSEKDKKVSYKQVKLGPIRQGMLEILEGLKDTDRVVLRTSRHLAEGEEVQVE